MLCISIAQITKNRDYVILKLLRLQECRFSTAVRHGSEATKNMDIIPANFFWDVGVRFLSWECWDFWKRHDHFRRFPKKSEVFRRRPKSTEGEALEKMLIHKIRDREEGIVIYSFYTWFSFLTWVWVNIVLEIMSSKTATTHIFQSGVRNWPASVSRREIEVFNPQAWELAGIYNFAFAVKFSVCWQLMIGLCINSLRTQI